MRAAGTPLPALIACAGCVASALAAACRGPAPPPAPAPPVLVASVAPAGARVVASNVERRDYAGSAACAPCHSEIYDKWKASPMRRMTRPGDQARAPFDGSTFHFKGDQVTMEAREGRRYVRVQSQEGGAQLFRVTRVIGGRYREDFTGVEVAGTEATSPVVGDPAAEPVLPVSYLLFDGRWRYKGYSVMVKERPHLGKHGAPWRQTCIFCHNTEPYLATVYDDLLGGGRSYQGSVSDRLLPEDRLWKAEVADPAALSRALRDELAFLGASPARAGAPAAELLADAERATWDRFGEAQLVEVGIGCEACHNGARRHVDDPLELPSFEPRSASLRVAAPSPAGEGPPSRAAWINHTCARCHTVLFSRYPYTWEGGLRPRASTGKQAALHAGGGSTINSGEARDLLLGGCAGSLSCTACHDPHTEDSRERLDLLGTVAGNHVCTGCHPAYGEKAALAAHTHHAPEGAGSACLGCHMPRKNAGLAYRLTRYHRIGSPTDPARVERDRPLECALCHADKSVADLAGTMERWWGKRYERSALRALYGDDLAVSPLLPSLAGKPHEQITAAAVLGERGPRASAAALVPLLSSEYPLVRYWAREAVERLLGKPLPVDLDGEASVISTEAGAFVQKALAQPLAPNPRGP
jgi:predicted CXXCH cytochrome family protein